MVTPGSERVKKTTTTKRKTEEAIVVLWDNYINVHTEKVVVFLFHIIL